MATAAWENRKYAAEKVVKEKFNNPLLYCR